MKVIIRRPGEPELKRAQIFEAECVLNIDKAIDDLSGDNPDTVTVIKDRYGLLQQHGSEQHVDFLKEFLIEGNYDIPSFNKLFTKDELDELKDTKPHLFL